jgi:hypothetical protein
MARSHRAAKASGAAHRQGTIREANFFAKPMFLWIGVAGDEEHTEARFITRPLEPLKCSESPAAL